MINASELPHLCRFPLVMLLVVQLTTIVNLGSSVILLPVSNSVWMFKNHVLPTALRMVAVDTEISILESLGLIVLSWIVIVWRIVIVMVDTLEPLALIPGRTMTSKFLCEQMP